MENIFKEVEKQLNTMFNIVMRNLYCKLDYYDNKGSIIVYKKYNKIKKCVYVINLTKLYESVKSLNISDLTFISYYIISKHVKGD